MRRIVLAPAVVFLSALGCGGSSSDDATSTQSPAALGGGGASATGGSTSTAGHAGTTSHAGSSGKGGGGSGVGGTSAGHAGNGGVAGHGGSGTSGGAGTNGGHAGEGTGGGPSSGGSAGTGQGGSAGAGTGGNAGDTSTGGAAGDTGTGGTAGDTGTGGSAGDTGAGGNGGDTGAGGNAGTAGTGGNAGDTGTGGGGAAGSLGVGGLGGSLGGGGVGGVGGAGGALSCVGDCKINPGFQCCNGDCINPNNDIHNCGGCGITCLGAEPYCDNGTCGKPPCSGTTCGAATFCCGSMCCNDGELCCDRPGPQLPMLTCQLPNSKGTCDTGCTGCVCNSPDTLIATPAGNVRIDTLRVGDSVYSMVRGELAIVPLVQVHRVEAPNHVVIQVTMEGGSVLEISALHPTADGRTFGELRAGGLLDGGRIISVRTIPFVHGHTIDILPESDSGTYFAGGFLIGTTLAAPASASARVAGVSAPRSISPSHR